MAGLKLSDVRAKFPQYDNLSDQQLADSIHQRYYPQMDRGEFNYAIGYNPAPTGDVRPVARPEQRAVDQFVDAAQGLDFQSPQPVTETVPVSPRTAPRQPSAPTVDRSSVSTQGVTPESEIPVDVRQRRDEAQRLQELAAPFSMMGGGGDTLAVREAARRAALEEGVVETPVPPQDPAVDQFEGEGFGSLAKRRGQQFMEGAVDAFASLPEAVAIQQAQAARRDVAAGEQREAYGRAFAEDLRLIGERQLEIERALGINGQPRPSRENRLNSEQKEALNTEYQDLQSRKRQIELALGEGGLEAYQAESERERATPQIPAGERPVFAYGDRLRDASGEFFGKPDPQDTSFWGQVARGGGNMSAMAITAVATSVIGTPALGVTAAGGQGAGMNSSQMYKEAIDAGADEETAQRAAQIGAVIGASEIIPINRALKLLPPRLRAKIGGGVMKRFTDIAQASGEEAAQEYLATVANNIVAQNLYDPDRGWTEGATEAALVGAVLGGGTGAVGTAFDTRREAAGATPTPPEDEPEAQTDVEAPSDPSVDTTPVDVPAPAEEAQRTEPPKQPDAPLPPSAPSDDGAQPAPAPAEGAAPETLPQVGGPQQPITDAQKARADLKPDQWEEVPGMSDGKPTGRMWMTNTETGETISKEEYERRLAAAKPSPTGEGEVTQTTEGEEDATDVSTATDAGVPSQPDGTVPVSDQRDGDVRDERVPGSLADESRTPADETPAGAAPDTDESVREPATTTPDARLPRPSDEPGIDPGKPVTFEQAQNSWESMSPDERVDFLRRANPKGNEVTRQKFGQKPWSDISDQVKEGIMKAMDRLSQEAAPQADPEPVSAPGYEGRGYALEGEALSARDWMRDNGYENLARIMDLDASKGMRVDSAVKMANVLKAAKADGGKWPQPNRNGVYNDEDAKSRDTFTLQNTNKKRKAVAQVSVLEVAPGVWAGRHDYQLPETGASSPLMAATTYDSRDEALSAQIERVRSRVEGAAGERNATGSTKKEAKRILEWLDKAAATLQKKEGAAADPAFKAAKDGGKIEVVSVTPETEAKKRDVVEQARAAAKGGFLVVSAREVDDARGKYRVAVRRTMPDGEIRTKYAFGDTVEAAVKEAQRMIVENAPDAGDLAQMPTSDAIEAEAAQADPNPTDAQKEAGNYKAGHISWNGLDITIENAKGSERSGTDSDGETWSVTMPAHYGYIKRTEGADGDHVDVYIGDNPESDVVVVIDQIDLQTGTFDEHKVVLGAKSGVEAQNIYRKGFSDGRGAERRGGVTRLTVDEFKDWLENGDTTKPMSPDVKKEGPASDDAGQSNREVSEPVSDEGTQTQDETASQQPTVEFAKKLSSMMGEGGFPTSNMKLMKMASEYFGGTIAEGAFSPKDAYEALELAVNMYVGSLKESKGQFLAYDPSLHATGAKMRAEGLQAVVDELPTQTRRDTETDAFQQFSTPPSYAYAVNWIANIQEGERVLEPSAGNGGIAIFAKNAGAKVDVNELADRRIPSLEALGFNRVTQENAEQIGNIFDDAYDVVVMNPPFSASAGRTSKNTSATGAKHIEQALSLLKPGGRLVAIMGHTFHPSNSRVAPFFKRIAKDHDVRANVVVKGDQVYKKYGTTYDNRLIVIDKVAPAEGSETLTGEAESIPELIDIMEGIRNEASDRRTKDAAGAGDGGDARRAEGGDATPAGGRDLDREPVTPPRADDLGREGDQPERDSGVDREDRGAEGAEGRVAGSRRQARPDGDPRRQPGTTRGRGKSTDGSRKPTVRVTAAEETQVEETSGGFAKYRPSRIRIENAQEHPIALVESSAMATVNPPKPDYDMQVPPKMVKDGLLSEAQLEQVMYAGAAHSEMLPSAPDKPQYRKGYFIGDGTGVGKTREIAGIIADNWAQGRKKHVLISKDKKLFKSARRDFDNVGMKSVGLTDLGGIKADKSVPSDADGVLFATYSAIGRNAPAGKKSRLDQIVDWVGPDFDGTITFDEAHLAGNAIPIKGKRGTSKPSATALAVVDLQERLPNARVVYASATGATEVHNLAYAARLGLWGPGTPFPTVDSFVTQINKGGVAAMEVVARDMKQMGIYMARSISFDGVEYDKLEHKLSGDQREMYDAAAEAWQNVLANVNEVIQDHTQGGGRQRGAALAQFWGAHQRFFQQVLTSMQMPTVLKDIETEIKAGKSPVVQIVNTNEAATKRAMSKMEEGDSLDDIDITPREDLIQYLETSFPIHQYEDYEDDNGNVRQRPAKDSQGNFIINKEAVRIRDELVGKLGAMTLPGNPLDMIIEKFGADNVAEITGRSSRIVKQDGKSKRESRSQSKALAEAAEYQAGKRDVLVFSDAGGTGMDFHADLGVKNTKRRAHYVLQAGWRADRAIQGFGRTHRTNQAQAPQYKLAGTDLSGHKRFTSSIARRLDQLGALTKGQKDSSSSMFSAADNLENEFAENAVNALFYEIWQGDLDGFTIEDASKELGLNLVGERGFNVSAIPPVPQFLNRLLNTKIDRQNMLFDRFMFHMDAAIQRAVENGEYTSGVEAVDHDGAVLTETQEAFRDETTGAKSQYQIVKLTKRVEVTPFEDIDTRWKDVTYKKHRDTGTVYAFKPASTRIGDKGERIPTYMRYSPTDRSIIDSPEYQFRHSVIQKDEAEKLWNEAIADAPATREETMHMVTGALLPIWDRLPTSSPKIVRVTLDDGRSLLGREIPDVELTRTLENLGVTGEIIEMTADEIQAAVLQGRTILLSSGHKIVRRKVGGEQRIEVVSPNESKYADTKPGGTLQRLGFQMERIQFQPRAFVATGERGAPALDAFMQGKSIVNVTMEREQRVDDSPLTPYREILPESRVFKTFNEELRKLGLGDVELQFDPFFAHEGKAYADHFGRMVLTIGNTLNPRWTMGHEAVHFYKHMGLFTRSEWKVLSDEAEPKWMERYDIDARYPDLTREERIEEAVAEAFGEAYEAKTGFRTTGKVREVLRSIRDFLKAVRNWAKGLGLKSPSDVIEAMARGEFSKRRDPAGWASQTERLMREKRKPSEANKTRGGMYLPDRYLWDTLARGNGNLFNRLKDARGALGDRLDLARTRIQDRFLPVLRAQQVIEREMGAPIPEEMNAYLAEEMYSGRTGHKLDAIDNEFTSKIIEIIGANKGMTTETVGRFLYARHAAERNERIAQINPDMPDGGSGMATEEADLILSEIQKGDHAEAYNQIAELIDNLREWSITERVNMGLMKEGGAKAWRNAYKAYVPLKGWAETDHADAELDVTGIGRGYNVRGDETKRALGRSSEAFNPLIAAITQAQEVAVRSEKNRVGQHLYRLAKDVPAKALWEIKQADTMRVFNESTGLVEERTVSPITLMQSPNEMAVKVDGEEYRIVFNDPRLARSATRVGVDGLGPILKPLSMFGRYISAVNTMMNPEFVINNFARDTVTANINIQSKELGTKIQKGMMKDLPKAMRGAYRGLGGKSDTEWSKYYQEFSEAGGKVSFWVIENPEANQKTIERRMRREAGGAKGMALALVTPSTELNPALRFIERINLAVDNAVRLAAFVHARKNGMTSQEAASLSKNLTVNFNRRGEYGSAINAAYVFANAAMQGTHVMFKALKSRRVQAIATGLVLISYLLDQANAYLSDEDEDGQLVYDKIPDWKSERSLVLMLGPGADNALTIPMPYGYNVFTYMGNRLSKLQRGAIDADQALGDTAKAAFSSFSPISGGNLLTMITPTAIDPIAEITTNEDWLGRAIYPDYPNMTGPDSQRYFASVTSGAKNTAEKVNEWTGGTYAESGYVDVSPETIDHVAAFLLGGVGRTFGRFTDFFTKTAKGEEVETKDIPFVRNVYMEVDDNFDASNYFDRRTQIREAYAAAKAYHEAGDEIPDHIRWKAELYKTQQQAERMRRGTKTVKQDKERAYRLLNSAYIRAWKQNTPYSSETIFGQR